MILPAAYLAAQSAAARERESQPVKDSDLKSILDNPDHPRHQDLLDLIENAKTAPERQEQLGVNRTPHSPSR